MIQMLKWKYLVMIDPYDKIWGIQNTISISNLHDTLLKFVVLNFMWLHICC